MGFLQRIFGGVRSVPDSEFLAILKTALTEMAPFSKLGEAQGLSLELAKEDWDTYAAGLVDVLTRHLTGSFQAANNHLNSVRPALSWSPIHKTAMMAVRGYGETLFAYLDHQHATFTKDPSFWATYRKEVHEWDSVTCDALARFLREVENAGFRSQVFPDGLPPAFETVEEAGGAPEPNPLLFRVAPVFADLMTEFVAG